MQDISLEVNTFSTEWARLYCATLGDQSTKVNSFVGHQQIYWFSYFLVRYLLDCLTRYNYISFHVNNIYHASINNNTKAEFLFNGLSNGTSIIKQIYLIWKVHCPFCGVLLTKWILLFRFKELNKFVLGTINNSHHLSKAKLCRKWIVDTGSTKSRW